MPTSWEVSQMFAAQQQAFAAQNAYANTIGISNPGLNVGAYGGSPIGGFQPVPGGLPGFAPPPPVYNYGYGGWSQGYGSGSRFAGGVMSGMSGLAAAGGIGLGIASMFGRGGPVAAAIDPISGFMGGFGGLSARGVMGGLAGAAVPLAIGTAVAETGAAFFRGGHQQQQIANQLGQFQFYNPQSRTGMGFTRQDAQDIGGTIRSLAHVPEMLTSVEELTRLLPRMRQMGMMQGVKDAGEFATRFKEAVGTIHKMAQHMGTTMEDAARFFEHSRHMGFFDRQGQLQNMLNAQFTSGITGMNMGEVMGMQAAGAAQAQQFGANRQLGARAVTTLAQRIGLARRGGMMPEELILNATGLEGPEGDRAAAIRMQGLLMNISKTPLGQAVMIGAMKRDETGKIVLDDQAMEALSTGRMTIEQAKAKGERLNDEDKIAFKYHAANLSAQFAEKVDIGAIAGRLLQDRGPEAGKYLLQQLTGASEADIELLSATGGGGGRGVEMEGMFRIQQREARIAERTDPSRIWKRIKTGLHAATLGQVERGGAEFFNYLGKQYDQFIDDLVGRHVIELSKGGAEAFRRAMTGGGSQELRDMFAAAQGLRGTAPRPGGVGRFLGGLFGEGLRSYGLPGITGRTAQQEADLLSRQLGVSRADLDRRAGLISAQIPEAQGGTITAAGEKASEALWDVAEQVASGQPGWETYGEASKKDLLRQGIINRISQAAFGLSGHGAGYHNVVNAALRDNTMNRQQLETLAGELEKAGKTDEALLVRAGASGLTQGGDFGTAVIASTRQREDKYRVNLGLAASNAAAKRAESVEEAQSWVQAANNKLSDTNLDDNTKAVLRSNQPAREVLNAALNGEGDVRKKIRRALALNSVAEARKELRDAGFEVSLEDVQQIRSVWGDVKKKSDASKAVGEAIGEYHNSVKAVDWAAGSERMRDIGLEITGAAQKAEGISAGLQEEIIGLGQAVVDISKEGTVKGFDTRMADIRKRMVSLAQAYSGIGEQDDKGREAFMAATGPMGRAIADISAQVNALGEEGSPITARALMARGLTQSEARQALGQADTGILDKQTKASIISTIAGARASSVIMPAGDVREASTPDQELLSTLKTINQTIALQTTFMEVSAKKGMSDEEKKELKRAADAVRANAQAGAGGRVVVG